MAVMASGFNGQSFTFHGYLPIDKKELHVYTTHHPIGIVAAIVPWNAQMFLTATKLAPALAAGCSVIIKASEIAPCAMFELAKLIDEAGFPKGVIFFLKDVNFRK